MERPLWETGEGAFDANNALFYILIDSISLVPNFISLKCLSICFFAAVMSAVADIDSGGGSAVVGGMTNTASIGSSFATGNFAVGTNENKSGLIQVLFTGSDASNPDANANGLPDEWENQYFPGQTVNPLADADGDGASNLMEYVAGTNPTDRSSKLQPNGTHNGSIYTMPIQTVAGRNYKVWVTKNLSSWTLQQSYTGDGTQKVFMFDEATMPAGPLHSLTHPSSYFFRVEVVLP